MNQIAEKVGLYDLWMVLFPGIIGHIVMLIDYRLLTIIRISDFFSEWNLTTNFIVWIVALFASYFWGIVFQEIGRVVRKAFKLVNAAEGLLDQGKNVFSANEIRFFKENYAYLGYKNVDSLEESARLFHAINIMAQKQGSSSGFVKLSLQQKMALSLSSLMMLELLFSVIAVTYLFFRGRCEIVQLAIIIGGVSVLLLIVFLKRSERYNRYWVRNVVYSVCSQNWGLSIGIEE